MQNKWQQNWEVVCTRAHMSLIKGESNQLLKVLSTTDQQNFHCFTDPAPISCNHISYLRLLNLFHWKHSCPFWGTGLSFLLTGLSLLCIWPGSTIIIWPDMTIMYVELLFRSPSRGCLPTSPSVYLHPASHLCCGAHADPGLQQHRCSFPGAALAMTV